jgi:hypothetical protein
MRPVILKDALHNASASIIRNEQDATYARGIIIGAVSAVMALTGHSWADAWAKVQTLCPADMANSCIPDSWK